MIATTHRLPRLAAAALLVPMAGLCAGFLSVGCEKKMDPAECDKIRQEAYELLTKKAHPCGTDADCKEAAWPQCRLPVNSKNFDALAEMQKKTTEGKCEQKSYECKDSPEVYCKQGLCVNRELGELRDRE